MASAIEPARPNYKNPSKPCHAPPLDVATLPTPIAVALTDSVSGHSGSAVKPTPEGAIGHR